MIATVTPLTPEPSRATTSTTYTSAEQEQA